MHNILYIVSLPFFASLLSRDYEIIGYGFAFTICTAILCFILADRQNMGGE